MLANHERILPNNVVPVDLISDVISCLSIIKIFDIERIMQFTGKGRTYVNSAVKTAVLLGILEIGTLNVVELDKNCTKIMNSTPSIEKGKECIRFYIQNFKPFINFLSYCSNGHTTVESARKVYSSYNFKGKDAEFLMNLFIKWGTSVDIFVLNSNNEIMLNKEIDKSINVYDSNKEQLDNVLAIKQRIIKILGRITFDYLTSNEETEIIESYLKSASDPRSSISCVGRAFEDFLRRISIENGVDVSKCNGITQLINTMYSYRDATGTVYSVIHSKQQSIGSAIGSIRNMAGHGMEAKSLERWEISKEACLPLIELTLLTIKSVHLLLVQKKYEF